MFLLTLVEWLGRSGTKAVAASLVLGVLLPGLSETVRPYFPVFVFCLLTSAFLRVDHQRFMMLIRKPQRFVLPLIWILVAVPAIGGTMGAWLLQDLPEGTILAIVIMLSAPPVMSMVSFLAILRLDSALGLALLLGTSLLAPFTAPVIVELFAPAGVSIDGLALGRNLLGFTLAAAVVAALSRRIFGDEKITAAKTHIDGVNVILLFLFAIALMGNLGEALREQPGLVAILFVLSFVIAALQIGLTSLIFFVRGSMEAFSIGMSSGSRNMGLLIAVTASAMPDSAWLWFAIAQFPIYFMPFLAEPFARLVTGTAGSDRV